MSAVHSADTFPLINTPNIMNIINRIFNRSSVVLEIDRTKPLEKSRNISLINQYVNLSEGLQNTVDDRTWKDLELDYIFSFIDRTLTKTGEQYFYRLLQKEQTNSQRELINCIISHYSNNPDQLSKAAQILRKYEKNSTYSLQSFLHLRRYKRVPYWIRILSFSSFSFAFGSLFHASFILPFIAILLINTAVHYYLKTKINLFHFEFKNIKALYDNYLKLAKLENQDNYLSKKELAKLKVISKKCFYLSLNIENADELSAAVYYLIEIIKATILYDGLQFNSTIKLIEENIDIIQKTSDYIGISDTSQSLYYLKNYTKGVKPSSSSDKLINIKNAYHPLIEDCIVNSISIDGTNVIITGGNMSGKTTFLKTLGINIFLAQTINYSFCDYLEIPKIKVISSIASNDNLMQGKSYFMDELERANIIITQIYESEQPHLILIDEIFRGTNSQDRIALAASMLLYFNYFNCIVVVTTHDLDTIDLVEGMYDTYYFDNIYQDNQVHFDFIIKRGIQHKTNVLELIKSLNYPSIVIQQTEKFRKIITAHNKKAICNKGFKGNISVLPRSNLGASGQSK